MYGLYFGFAYFVTTFTIRQGFTWLKDYGKNAIIQDTSSPLKEVERLDKLSSEGLKLYKKKLEDKNSEEIKLIDELIKKREESSL